MKIKAISNFSYMNYIYYLNQPMQMIERKLNLIIAENTQLVNSLNRYCYHSLIRKKIDAPFND